MCVDETNNVINVSYHYLLICATTVMSFKRGTFQRPLTLARTLTLAVQSETVDKALSETIPVPYRYSTRTASCKDAYGKMPFFS